MFQVGEKHLAIGGRLDGPGAHDAAQTQGAESGEHLPLPLGCGFGDPCSAPGSPSEPGHLRRHSALIEENQLLGRDRAEGFQERLPPLLVCLGIALLRGK